jgi:hypothetical protein
MFSAAFGFRDGVQTWTVVHDPDQGMYSLATTGEPPPELDAIRTRLKSQQEAEGGEEADVDFMFDAAPDLVAALSGYERNRGDPIGLTRLQPIRRGFLKSLFGRG